MNNYKVGYGRPSKANQFKRGQSGNLAGRSKGSLNLVTDLAAELSEKITVRESGRPHRISKQRALLKSLMAKALQGDVRATAAVLALYARLGVDTTDHKTHSVDESEIEILRRFAPRLLRVLAKGE